MLLNRRLLPFLVLAAFPEVSRAQVTITVDTAAAPTTISPLSYGTNQDPGGSLPIPFFRQGGNRTTGYNWENSASNAGSDYGPHHEDWFALQNIGLPQNDAQLPATVVVKFIKDNRNRAAGFADSIVTLQLAGYVAADGDCNCNVTITGPADTGAVHWKRILNDKPGAPGSWTLAPDETDGFVYMDEFLNYLFTQQGNSSTTGAKYFSLDNEPALWGNTHPLIYPNPPTRPTYQDVTSKGVSMATLLTAMDPGAQVFGPASYGWSEFTTMQSAPGRPPLHSPNFGVDFLCYYLDQFNLASQSVGRRLLHRLDVHWYPEATGSNGVSQVRVTTNDISQGVAIARMQAPRSLWDPTYVEYSWITGSGTGSPITLLSRLQSAVNRWYPGTQVAVTEYNFGAANDVSGGVAHADMLGILGKYGAAGNWWGLGGASNFVRSAYRLYLNYDGAGKKFGDLSLPAASSSVSLVSAYASRSSSDPDRLWVVLLSKDYSNPNPGDVSLTNLGGVTITGIRAFRFSSSTTTGNLVVSNTHSFSGAGFSDTLPARSGTLYEITLSTAPTPTPTDTPTVTPSPTDCLVSGTPCTSTMTATATETRTETPTATATVTATITPTPAVLYRPFPNPLEGTVSTFTYRVEGSTDKVSLSVFTTAFRKLHEDASLATSVGLHTHSLDWDDLVEAPANGIYYLVVTFQAGSVRTREVMKVYLRR